MAADGTHAAPLLEAAEEKRLLFKQRVFFGSCPDVDHLVHWLNTGAAQVVFTGPAGKRESGAEREEFVAQIIEGLGPECPAHRISLLVNLAAEGVSAIAETASLIQKLLPGLGIEVVATIDALEDSATQEALLANAKTLGEFRLTIRIDGASASPKPEMVALFHKKKIDVKAPVANVETGTELAARCYVACARTDRADGLYSTVVVDENGVALGLVYSSKESIVAAICSGRGFYYSRSRGGLWRKGDTSGAVQDLQCVDLDCDNDALMFSVIQRGEPPSFCHTGTRTCWGKASGMAELELTLRARRASAPEGSYTKRLFDDPVLLRRKLLEEANELAEAEEPDHVAAEAADVLYFALTRCVAAGVGLREIGEHLDYRSMKVKRRTGNAKSAEQRKKWGDVS